jgi:chromosome segregation ATPase
MRNLLEKVADRDRTIAENERKIVEFEREKQSLRSEKDVDKQKIAELDKGLAIARSEYDEVRADAEAKVAIAEEAVERRERAVPFAERLARLREEAGMPTRSPEQPVRVPIPDPTPRAAAERADIEIEGFTMKGDLS